MSHDANTCIFTYIVVANTNLAGFSVSIETAWPIGMFNTRTNEWKVSSRVQQLPASTFLPTSDSDLQLSATSTA